MTFLTLIHRALLWLCGVVERKPAVVRIAAIRPRSSVHHFRDRGVNVVMLTRGSEYYEFRFTDERSAEAIYKAARFAGDPRLAFDWEDAARCYAAINGAVERECSGR